MRIQSDLLNCVVFIGRQVGVDVRWIATGFIVVVPAESDDDLNIGYLVTVRHTAYRLEGVPLVVRFNTPNGPALVIIPPTVRRWYHPTEAESVDVAIIAITPPASADYKVLSSEYFMTNKAVAEFGIGPGDEVFSAGLFTRCVGDARGVPLVRTGNVAMMPPEPLPSVTIGDYTGPAEGYLIESRSLGGLSGSPVFVRHTVQIAYLSPEKEDEPVMAQSPGRWFLMGMMHGHWTINPADVNRYDFAHDKESVVEPLALGISVVVPAKKILEVLNQAGLVAERAEWAAIHKGNSPKD